MNKNEEFLNSSGVPEWLPTRIDPALYNYDPGNMIPGSIWYRGSRYTEFKYILIERILTHFEFSTERTTWFYNGVKFTEGRVIRTGSAVPQSSIVENRPKLSPQFVNMFQFDLMVLDRIKDPEVVYVTAELRKAWSLQS
jgi:hypothetical protein